MDAVGLAFNLGTGQGGRSGTFGSEGICKASRVDADWKRS